MTQAQNTPKPTQTTQAEPKSDFEMLLDKDWKDPARRVEFTPFLADDPITMSPGMVIKFLCRPTKSGKVCTEAQAIKFIMLCKARKLNPWEGDAYIVGYDASDGPEFNLVTAHQALLKRAEVHPQFDGMTSGVTVMHKDTEEIKDMEGDFYTDDCEVVGGWARIYFKARTHPMYRRLRLKTFKKPYGVWNSNPEGMIVKCAEADALRSSFPNHVGGMYLEGEMIPNEAPKPAPQPTNEQPARRMTLRRVGTKGVRPGSETADILGAQAESEPLSADNPVSHDEEGGAVPHGSASPVETQPIPQTGRPGPKKPTQPAPVEPDEPTDAQLAAGEFMAQTDEDGVRKYLVGLRVSNPKLLNVTKANLGIPPRVSVEEMDGQQLHRVGLAAKTAELSKP